MGKFEFTHSLPIAMWDSSWIELHYPGGPFEDWDKVIDELIERGYEAVRIDVAPHLIASDFNGDIQEVFYYDHRGAIGTSLWGRRFSLEINTRKSVVEFIKKLQQRNIKIGLATWIKHAGLVSAQLAADAGYAFICSCNFCHPQHAGIWNDIEWHKKVTDIIRKGKPIY